MALPSLLDAELVVLFPEGLECKVLIITNTTSSLQVFEVIKVLIMTDVLDVCNVRA